MAEGCIEALHQGFFKCNKKVKWFFPGLDLKDVIESNNEGEGEEEGDEGVAKIITKLIDIEGMTMGVVAEETTAAEGEVAMEEVIIGVVNDTKAMVTEVTEDSGVAQSGTPKE